MKHAHSVKALGLTWHNHLWNVKADKKAGCSHRATFSSFLCETHHQIIMTCAGLPFVKKYVPRQHFPSISPPSIALLSEPQWGLPLTEPLRPYSLDYNRRSRSDGRKLSTPSTSRTPAARRGEPSTNLLAGLDAPPACAPSRQIPSPCNWWRTGTQD